MARPENSQQSARMLHLGRSKPCWIPLQHDPILTLTVFAPFQLARYPRPPADTHQRVLSQRLCHAPAITEW